MAILLKPAAGASINTSHAIATGLVRCVLLNEGVGSATELVGGATAALSNGAIWHSHMSAGGTLVDFPGADDTISFGQGGLSHGNGNVSVFFGGTVTVDATENWAGAIAGTGVDTYAWGIGDDNAWRFTLRDVAHITATGTGPVQGRVYTVGMGYTDSTSVRFHIYDHTTEAQITPETVLSASVPGQVAAASVIGNADDGSGSWARRLSFTYIWNRVLTDAEFVQLHASPWCFLQYRPPQTRASGGASRGRAGSTASAPRMSTPSKADKMLGIKPKLIKPPESAI